MRLYLQWISGTRWKGLRNYVGHDFYIIDGGIFRGVGALREILRRIEVGKMVESIVSLAVCVGLLIYLVYAMLRPEKF